MESCRPRIILSAAMSADGKIATVSGDSKLSSRRDSVRVHKLRSRVDAILIGKNTAVRDDPLLTVRLARGKNPIRVILDSSGGLPPTSKILKTCHDVPTIIAVSKKIPQRRLSRLRSLPVEVVVAGQNTVSLRLLMGTLAKKGIKSVLVEGGGTVNWALFKDGLFDELYIAVSPFIVGGARAVPLVGGRGFGTVAGSARLSLVSAARLGDHVVLHYKRAPPAGPRAAPTRAGAF